MTTSLLDDLHEGSIFWISNRLLGGTWFFSSSIEHPAITPDDGRVPTPDERYHFFGATSQEKEGYRDSPVVLSLPKGTVTKQAGCFFLLFQAPAKLKSDDIRPPGVRFILRLSGTFLEEFRTKLQNYRRDYRERGVAILEALRKRAGYVRGHNHE